MKITSKQNSLVNSVSFARLRMSVGVYYTINGPVKPMDFICCLISEVVAQIKSYSKADDKEQFAEFFGAERECSVAREISKKFEEHKRGPLTEVAAWYREHEPKGEIVIIVAGAPEKKKEKKSYKDRDEE